MPKIFLPLALFSLACMALAQDNETKPVLSKDPLTAEQIAIYRAVLKDFVWITPGELNVVDRTTPLRVSPIFTPDECLKGIKFELPPATMPVVHKLDPAVPLEPGMVFVDPEIDIEQLVNIEPLVNKAPLFVLSEIAFDKSHTHAMVATGFSCGLLCGHGDTVFLTRVIGAWEISRKCGGWES